ncbi:MAG: hypothetical protein KDI09_09075 [Halioglobus sp.]|nr:hypothetical protein [Halioglobus sp.]
MTKRTRWLAGSATVALLLSLLVYFLYLEFPAEPDLPGNYAREAMDWDRQTRSYGVYIPQRRVDAPALVLVFHGSGGSAAQSRAMYAYAFEQLAEQHGFIVLYPEGYEDHYNGCRKAGPYAANRLQIDDVGFMRALVARFVKREGVNPRAVFATGVSNGGQMALRLALEAPDLVAAVAPVATSLPTPDNMDCKASGRPVAFMLMNGTADPMNPYHGGEVALYGLLGNRGGVLSSPQTVEYFAQLAGYREEPVRSVLPDLAPDDGSQVEVTLWRAPGRVPVALYTVHGGGHSAPHPQVRLPRLLGGSNRDIVAAAEMWGFFQSAVESPTRQ